MFRDCLQRKKLWIQFIHWLYINANVFCTEKLIASRKGDHDYWILPRLDSPSITTVSTNIRRLFLVWAARKEHIVIYCVASLITTQRPLTWPKRFIVWLACRPKENQPNTNTGNRPVPLYIQHPPHQFFMNTFVMLLTWKTKHAKILTATFSTFKQTSPVYFSQCYHIYCMSESYFQQPPEKGGKHDGCLTYSSFMVDGGQDV